MPTNYQLFSLRLSPEANPEPVDILKSESIVTSWLESLSHQSVLDLEQKTFVLVESKCMEFP